MEKTILLQGVTPNQLAAQITGQITEQLKQLKKDLLNKSATDELMTRKEACIFLQVNDTTLWHWTNKGRVTAYGIANKRYYKRSELMEALKPLKK